MSGERCLGGCRCGAVQSAVDGECPWSAGCCCRDCARATGTPFVVWEGFPPARVTVTAGQIAMRETSRGVIRGSCGLCGTPLIHGRAPGSEVREPIPCVTATRLDEPARFPPTELVWNARRPGWFALATSVSLQDGPGEVYAARANNAVRGD